MVDFPAILAAVKPRQRKPQYSILAGLYALGAHRKPVTTNQLTDLLDLHLRSKVPVNVNARLREYSNFVAVAHKGPPLKWKLTENGIKQLRDLSGLALPTAEDDEKFDYDIGIVCALEQPEFAAVVAALGGDIAWREIGSARFAHVYRACEMRTDAGESLRIVGTTSTSMGLTAASIVTTQLVQQFRPRIVVMIGIAAGTRDGGKQFGDVLVADPSVDYNSGKVVLAHGIRDFLPDPYPIGLNPRLRSVLHKYRGRNSILNDIRASWKHEIPGAPNRLHVGPVGGADQVIDDPTRISEIQRNWRKLIGLEMETYGVYRACHEAPLPKPRFVSFKAVCDFAAGKTDSWQAYAAYVAAEFALRFLRREWPALWPKVAGGSDG